eukprot:5271632-Karenia_brevis.AAC.1
MRGSAATCVLWNFHVSDICAADLRIVLDRLRSDVDKNKQDTVGYIVIAAGDFNKRPADSKVFSVDGAIAQHFVRGDDQLHNDPINVALSQLTEIAQQRPTHYDHKMHTESKIDRIAVTIPPWALRMSDVRANIGRAPYSLFKDGISDHSPVHFAISYQGQKNKCDRPLPSW